MRMTRMMVAVVAILFASAGIADAGLIEGDFATLGDGFLIRDTTNNREWVDVAKTAGISVNQFFTTSIFAGGGFQLATQADLVQLYTEAGATQIQLDNTIIFNAGNLPAATLLAGLMEHASPWSQMSGNDWIHGYMDFGSPTNLTLSRFNAFGGGGTASFGINTNGASWTYDTQNGQVGVWAVRDMAVTSTPEPVSMALLGLTTLGGIGLRLRRNRRAQDAQAAA